MIDFKERPDLGWNSLLVISLLAILTALWFGVVSPVKTLEKSGAEQVALLNATVVRANQKRQDDLHHIQGQSWTGPVETVGSTVLSYVSDLCEKHHVQLTAFRTEKSVDVAKLTEAPFVVAVEGGFPDVLAFSKSLEDPSSKLAVNLLQVGASDSGPGRVTATLGLLGFLVKEPH
jgi:hypothetical protein